MLIAVAALLLSGLVSIIVQRQAYTLKLVGAGGAFLGSMAGFIFSLCVLIKGEIVTLRRDWHVPYGSFYFSIDSLSAFFLCVLFLLSMLIALYATGYLERYAKKKNLGIQWCLFNCFIASMALVLTARNGILFLFLWEVMSLLSFFLVTFEHEDSSVRRAGLIYLTATHIGTACLLVSFVLLGRGAADLDFNHLSAAGKMADWVFILAHIVS